MIHCKWNVNFILCVNLSWLMQTIMYLVDLKWTNIFFPVITCDENFALKKCSFFLLLIIDDHHCRTNFTIGLET